MGVGIGGGWLNGGILGVGGLVMIIGGVVIV